MNSMKQNYSVINFSLVSHILGGKPEATAAGIEQRPGREPRQMWYDSHGAVKQKANTGTDNFHLVLWRQKRKKMAKKSLSHSTIGCNVIL